METRFKVGDRVIVEYYGEGVFDCFAGLGRYGVVAHQNGRYTSSKIDKIKHVQSNHDPCRAMIAAMAMQGLLSNPHEDVRAMSFQEVIDAAVEYAEALEDALQKPKP
jgi:aspartate/methionine/tyrosine aminotransferase